MLSANRLRTLTSWREAAHEPQPASKAATRDQAALGVQSPVGEDTVRGQLGSFGRGAGLSRLVTLDLSYNRLSGEEVLGVESPVAGLPM